MTRTAADIQADLAAVAERRAELDTRAAALHRELAAALRAATAEAPARPVVASPRFLTTREAAEMLGTTPRALDAMRRRGTGPAYVLVGRRVRYPFDGAVVGRAAP